VIKRLTYTSFAVAALLGLAACGDQPQEMNANGVKQDNASYQGVAHESQYVQLKARAQYGQNDYQRVGAQPK
jgi:starvation-inducible outer membrane lipoprotein